MGGRRKTDPHSGARRETADLPTGTIVDHRFEIIETLGRGGFATVYVARDRELQREVALKVLHPDLLDSSALARLKREAAVAREVTDANLVHIYDFGQSADIAYLAMEKIDGPTLARLLDDGPLRSQRVADIARSILKALQALHEAGLVHRDVKPSNVLIPPAAPAKLGDLGLIRRIGGGETVATEEGAVLGTIEYLAPEQLRGEDATAACDLYSLGVVLYEALTGRLPFPDGKGIPIALSRLESKPCTITRIEPSVPPWLARIVHRLLKREPKRRYRNAGQVLRDLEKRTPPLIRYRPRLLRRVILLIILLTSLFGSWMAQRAARIEPYPPFSHAAPQGPGRYAGLARDGSLLWSSPGFESRPVPFRSSSSGPLRLAATCGPPPEHSFARSRHLCIFDSESGGLVSSLVLPTAADLFPGFARRFVSRVYATDLDGDGGDEIVVTSLQLPLWPSYSVLYEPRINRSRVVFAGSGHHYLVAATDVDGDGHKDLLFLGINNLMGWNNGLAAVRLEPAVNEPGRTSIDIAASTPDHLRTKRGSSSLLWYVLVPSKFGVTGNPAHYVRVDSEGRTILLRSPVDGSELAVGFDGFLVRDRSELPAASRRSLRRRAYADLRAATTAEESRRFVFAADRAEHAAELSRRASDQLLTEWAARREGVALIDAHRFSKAEAFFDHLWSTSSDNNLAYDAAKSFFLNGRPDLALAWFRRGLKARISTSYGRQAKEFIEGELFCLYVLGRGRAAIVESQRAMNAYPQGSFDFAAFKEFLRWRTGEKPRDLVAISGGKLGPGKTDLNRYWEQEFRWNNGTPAADVLRSIDRELERSTETVPLLLSLKAVVLERLGRITQALHVIETAVRKAQDLRTTTIEIRAQEDLIAHRMIEIAKLAHQPRLERRGEEIRSRWWSGLGGRKPGTRTAAPRHRSASPSTKAPSS